MRRLSLLISGNVQKTGYRDIVIRFGTALGLTGYAENLSDGNVKVAAEGVEQKLDLLKECANIRDPLINVEKIEGSYSDATGEFSNFYKLVKEGETDERLDKAAELLKEMIAAMNNGFSGLNNTMISGFNRLGEGQDKTLEQIKGMNSDMNEMHSDMNKMHLDMNKMHSDINAGFSDLKEEVHMQRDDFKELFMKEVSELHSEINDIRATLFRMQQAQEV